MNEEFQDFIRKQYAINSIHLKILSSIKDNITSSEMINQKKDIK